MMGTQHGTKIYYLYKTRKRQKLAEHGRLGTLSVL